MYNIYSPHVTISCSDNVSPVYSNELLSHGHESTTTPVDALVIDGVVGAELDGQQDHSGAERLLSAQDYATYRQHFQTHSKSSSMHTGPDADVHTLHIFDFDGTLVDTADRDEAVWEYQRLTGLVWPHRDFFTCVESLLPPLNIAPGPALPVMRQFAGRRGTHTVMLSGRHVALQEAVNNVMGELGVLPDAYELKPTVQESTVQFKAATLQRLIESMPLVRTVKVFEDDEETIAAMNAVQASFDGKRDVAIKIANAADLADKVNASLRGERSAIRTWLQRSGYALSDDESALIRECKTLIGQTWIDATKQSGCALASADLTPDQVLLPFGSQPLGRRSDIDLCLLGPERVNPMHCIQLLSKALKDAGIDHSYIAHSDRCPRLKLAITSKKCPPLEFDVIFACLSTVQVDSIVAGSKSLDEIVPSAHDQVTRTALQGPVFLATALHTFASKGVPAADVAAIIDFTQASLSRANLAGNTFHCIRTFHVVSLLVDFLKQQQQIQTANLDVFFADFIHYCASLTESQWNTLCSHFVPTQYIQSTIQHFKQMAELTSASRSTAAQPVTRIAIETIKDLLRRQTFPPAGFIECVLTAQHADSILNWQLGTFIKARVATYLRRLLDQHNVAAVVPCSLSESMPCELRFAVPNVPDIYHQVAHCFEEFWTELVPYTKSNAHVSARINGNDFFSPESAAKMLSKDLDPAVLAQITAYAKVPSSEPLHLSASLTSQQRAIVHIVAEALGLRHASEGVGAARHIVLHHLC